MSDTEWLQNLKAGDTVVLAGCGLGRNERILATVDKATKRYIETRHGNFRRVDGRSSASGYTLPWLEEATPERVARVHEEYERGRLAWRLSQSKKWHTLSLDTLREVHALVFPEKPGK